MASKGGAVRWTDEQLAAHQAKLGMRTAPTIPAKAGMPAPAPAAPGPGAAFQALGRLAKGDMNKTEAAYAQHLGALKHDGKILDWKFHAIRVRLAPNTYYEPDFMVLNASGQIEIHEVKGTFTTEKGQIKVKLCAAALPWFRVFKCSKQKDGSWTIQEFHP
jgi:hypothetical protein